MRRNVWPGTYGRSRVWDAAGTCAIISASSTCLKAARGEVADERDQAIEDEADDADVDERHDDVGEPRGVPGVPDEEADADAARRHLGGDDGEPGEADTDAQAGEDVGRSRRHHDAPEELGLVEPQDARDVAIVLRDVADAHGGVDDHRPDRRDED